VKVGDLGEATQHVAVRGASLPYPTGPIGVEGYLSPEQVRDEQAQARSNVFTVGVMLYEMLVGQNPFAAPQHATTMYRIAYEEPSAVSLFVPDLPEYASAVLKKALAKEPELRYQSAAEMLADLNGQVAPDLTAVDAAIAARTTGAETAVAEVKPPKVRKPFPTKRVLLIAVPTLLALALAYGGYALYQSRTNQEAAAQQAMIAEGAAMVDHVAELKGIALELDSTLATVQAEADQNASALANWDSEWNARLSSYESRVAQVDNHNDAEDSKYESSYTYSSSYNYYTRRWEYQYYYSYTPSYWTYPDYPSQPAPVGADLSAEMASIEQLAARLEQLRSALTAESAQVQYFGVVYARMLEAVDLLQGALSEASAALGSMATTNPDKGWVLDATKVRLVDTSAVKTAIATVDQEVSLYTGNYGVTIDQLMSVESSETGAPASQ
jgi:hypothetical protein